MSRPRRFREYKVQISGQLVADFTIEQKVVADTAEQAARNVRALLLKNGTVDPLNPKVKIGSMKARYLKSDSVEHTSGG